jgi:hypothetical protein
VSLRESAILASTCITLGFSFSAAVWRRPLLALENAGRAVDVAGVVPG